MIKIILDVEGMACGMCEAHVNDAVRRAFPVKKVSSSHAKGKTEIISQEPLDEEKLKAYDAEFNTLYNEVMCNPNMRRYEKARDEVDELMKEITGILTLCVRGEDPMTCDPNAGSCGGDCGSCGGCH